MRLPLLGLLLFQSLFSFEIVDKPIRFGQERIELTREYIKTHYGLKRKNISITPRIIVVHYTAIADLNRSFAAFFPQKLPGFRSDISAASALNVSAHFLVDRDGTVYRLMDETVMARHVIGLNLYAIGIENVGGSDGREDLTQPQLESNIALVGYLLSRYPRIEYLIGHYEYLRFEKSPLWLEKDPAYRTLKKDPGERFMRAVRARFPELKKEP
ncbi:N-acetylmuramoyl-L-alanine amidase [Hydrogenimonas sp.]